MLTQHLVAAIQFQPKLKDPVSNLREAAQLVYEAAAKGAKVIVLPELSLSGNTLNTARDAATCAQSRIGYQTQAFISIARQFGCYVVFGYIELYDGKLYNSAAIVGPQGLSGNFQKHNLDGSDFMWAESSDGLFPSVVTPWGRVGVLIGRDVMNRQRESHPFYNPKLRFYYPGSVEILCVLDNWSESGGYPSAAWVELTEKLGANVIVSNRVGTEEGIEFRGGSCVIDKTMQVWSHGSSFTETTIVGGFVTTGI